MGNVNPPPISGQIVFTQNYLPPLEDGEYLITVQQTLLNTNPTGPNDQINESYVQTRRVAVRGERFSLNPGELNAIFPPDKNQGEYSNVLPHAVFSRKTLLWERTPDGTDSGKPWIAILLFDANDPPPTLQTIQVGDLQSQPFVYDPSSGQTRPSTLPSDAVSYPDSFRALNLEFALEYGQNWYDRCQAIDVPVTLLNQIAPSLDDLTWLGHARTVSMANKAGDSSGDGTFSSVIGNRMPTPNTQCTAHIVSLEGMGAYLPAGDDYTPAAINLQNGTPANLIRLVSLGSWTFTSVDPTESFEGYLLNASIGPLQRTFTGATGGPSDPSTVVNGAFAMGYTALNHQTRQGDQTVSWYRGPLVPFQPPSTIFIPPPDANSDLPATQINTADELVRYDPGTGMMDLSYAAAWELGRLLALQNKSFSVALYN
jgi:hypothetical protein